MKLVILSARNFTRVTCSRYYSTYSVGSILTLLLRDCPPTQKVFRVTFFN